MPVRDSGINLNKYTFEFLPVIIFVFAFFLVFLILSAFQLDNFCMQTTVEEGSDTQFVICQFGTTVFGQSWANTETNGVNKQKHLSLCCWGKILSTAGHC